jgi:hypothetical protein
MIGVRLSLYDFPPFRPREDRPDEAECMRPDGVK